MTLANAFRVSFYLSLAMACVCLFYGEWELKYIPWMAGMLPLIFGIMIFAYRREGRRYLSEQAANRLGTCIGLGTVLWIAFNVPRTDSDVVTSGLPWPAALVPLLAPLLPVLLLVKLFRPKRLRDFWVFQTIALVIVTLSCILAGEALFFVLLCTFLVLQIWCLGLFFLYRNMILAQPVPADTCQDGPAGTSAEGPALQRPRGWATSPGFKQVALFGGSQVDDPRPIPRQTLRPANVLCWSGVVLLAGLFLFLLLPRFNDSPWVPSKLSVAGRGSIKSGIDANAGLDLYREGTLELSTEPAFEVVAHDHHGGPANLSVNQHWRMQVLDEYSRGNWKPCAQSGIFGAVFKPSVPLTPTVQSMPEPVPADLAQSEVFLIFRVVENTAGGLPLADPIDNPDHVGMYPQVLDAPGTVNHFFKWFSEGESFLPPSRFKQSFGARRLQYGQIITPRFQTKEIPVLTGQNDAVRKNYLHYLVSQEMPVVIRDWTRALTARLLPELGDKPWENPANHPKIAQALSRHLAESGEFSYSLRLHRLGVSMDPTAEFLLKVKEGHCERYAAGLTLMLRSVSIPARIVRGYRGCQLASRGRYLVRQDQAHSWVEALVPSKETGVLAWLQLDPTPSASAASESVLPFFQWAWMRLTNPDFTWKSLVMEYNNDRKAEIGDQFTRLWETISKSSPSNSEGNSVWSILRWPLLASLCCGSVLLGYALWRRRQVHRTSPPAALAPLPGFYAHLLRVLERAGGLRPHTGQTPLEFAQAAQEVLAARLPASDTLAELPLRAVGVLYRHHFGGQPLTNDDCQPLETDIARLEEKMRERAHSSSV